MQVGRQENGEILHLGLQKNWLNIEKSKIVFYVNPK